MRRLPLLLLFAAFAFVDPSRADPNGTWDSVGPPIARYDHTAIVDGRNDRMVLFGGRPNDLWEMSLRDHTWKPILTDHRPAGLEGHSAIYDPVRQRMLVFGGHDDVNNTVWALSLAGTPAWSVVPVAGTPPQARYDLAAVYDPVRDAMIVFGGYNRWVLDDVWILTLSGTPTWSRLTITGEAIARYRHVAFLDVERDRLIVFGGTDGTASGDTWALELSGAHTWSRLDWAGDTPTPRARHSVAVDPVGGRAYVFGGTDGSRRNDLWSFDLRELRWERVQPAGAPPLRRCEATLVFDSRRERLLLHGGYEEGTRPLGDTWSVSLGDRPAWTLIQVSTGAPPDDWGQSSAAYDSKRDRVILFGGYVDSRPHREVHALSLGETPRWTRLTPVGIAPTPRMSAAVAYDPVGDRLIVAGGVTYTTRWENLDDVWALSLEDPPAWTRLDPEGARPRARAYGSMVYDARRERMILLGGDSGLPYLDAWELSLSGPPRWREIVSTTPGPMGRYLHTAVLDPQRDRLVVFAGQSNAPPYSLSDTWAMELGGEPAWDEIVVGATPPWAGSALATVYDPLRDRLVTSGDGLGAWALDFGPLGYWQLLPNSQPPSFHRRNGIYDPLRDRMIVANGQYGTTWALEWGEPTRPGIHAPARSHRRGDVLDVEYRLSNPLPGARTIEWTLATEPETPGLSKRGDLRVDANGEAALAFSVPMPSDAGVDEIRMKLGACYAGARGNGATSEWTLAIPRATEPELLGVRPNPVVRDAVVSFTLPAAGRASLVLFDVTGRRVSAASAELPAGEHDLPLVFDPGARPGVYFLRLAFAGRSLDARVVFAP